MAASYRPSACLKASACTKDTPLGVTIVRMTVSVPVILQPAQGFNDQLAFSEPLSYDTVRQCLLLMMTSVQEICSSIPLGLAVTFYVVQKPMSAVQAEKWMRTILKVLGLHSELLGGSTGQLSLSGPCELTVSSSDGPI
jgi:hypothetical protein